MEPLHKNNFLTFVDFYIFFLDPKNNSAISSSLIKKCIILSEQILLHKEFLLSLNNSSEISKNEKDFILNKLLSIQMLEEKTKNEKIQNEKNNQSFASMTFEGIINLFISTISTVFPLLNIFPDSLRKWFYIKFPSSFGSWKTRLLLLNIKLRQIFVFKESISSNLEKEINLDSYVVRWVGEKKEKFCFCMDKCNKEKNKLPKNILFASKDEALVKQWYCLVQELKEPSK